LISVREAAIIELQNIHDFRFVSLSTVIKTGNTDCKINNLTGVR